MTLYNKLKLKNSKLLIKNSKLNLKEYPWYLAGNINAANCIEAYQPKGAVSLAASYVNLANPGTYDCFPGDYRVAEGFTCVPAEPPTLSADGWVFADHSILRTGFILGSHYDYTFIIHIKTRDVSTGYQVGVPFGVNYEDDWTDMLGIWENSDTHKSYPAYGEDVNTWLDSIDWTEPHVVAISNRRFYVDGNLVTNSIPPPDTSNPLGEFSIGGLWCTNYGLAHDLGDYLCIMTVPAFAMYNRELTDAEYQAIRLAMLAL